MYVHTYHLFANTWRPMVSVITTLWLCCDYFSSSSVASCTFSALCMYSTFGHHPHALGYLCAKFRFCRSLHCWASPWKKYIQSLSHSITQLIWCAGNRSLRFGTKETFLIVISRMICNSKSISHDSAMNTMNDILMTNQVTRIYNVFTITKLTRVHDLLTL